MHIDEQLCFMLLEGYQREILAVKIVDFFFRNKERHKLKF